MAHFIGTEHETRTCPRRTLLRNADVVGVFDLRNDVGEAGLGVIGDDSVTAMAVEGLAVVDDAMAFRMKDSREVEADEAAVRAAAQAVRDGG